MESHEPSEPELRHTLEVLREQVATNRGDIDALLDRSDASSRRAEASDRRADVARRRASAGEARAAEDRHRIEQLEARTDIDRELILELHANGVLSREQVEHLREALRTSRRIGAAIGIIMTSRMVTEDDAFALLRRASQNSNRRVRDLADELVLTGDTTFLPEAHREG